MPTQFVLPALGESIESGTLVKLLVATGEQIHEEQPVLEIETDKAVTEVPSDLNGTVGKLLVKAGDKLKVGQPIFEVEADAAVATPEPVAKPQTAPAPATPVVASNGATQQPPARVAAPSLSNGNGALVAAAPSVRRLARELGIDVALVQGSGERGRVSYTDVKDFLQRSAPGRVAAPAPDFNKWGETQTRPLGGIGLAMAKQMARAWSDVPHVTHFDKADITALEELRKQFGDKVEKAGGKLTVTVIALKVVASALKLFPQFNSSIDLTNEQLILKQYVNIGVAVDTDRGLLVPVIRDVDTKSIIQLAVELTELSEKARSRKTTLDELQGGSFTITNLGGIGGTAFTPIVNVPEVAILGLARGATEPVWDGTTFQPRTMLPLSLSYDHRVIDGAAGARFTRWIARALADPFTLLLEG